MTTAEAYSACRSIARREAKNFYYAFRVLPRAKRDAMCAVYAFMRRADDLSDDESATVPERRAAMAGWLDAWRDSRAGAPGEDAVFVALADTQRRFGIADELLEQLVQGTAMDLEAQQAGVATVRDTTITESGNAAASFQVYETFAGLYQYCYLVASVVGLVCIQVFGYGDPRAKLLAEQTGVAFQLTNILRDVKEDAERGRIYLPLEDMRARGVEVEDVALAAKGVAAPERLKRLLALEAGRATEYYKAAEELLPLIDADSRAALWVMVTIYRGLLERIVASGFEVFGERISVPAPAKLKVLAQGAALAARHRVTG